MSKPKNKKIAWERWDVDIIEEDIVDELLAEHDEEDMELVHEALEFMEKIPKLVTTPLGVYQMHDKMNILNQFECWMGYTNFDISYDVRDEIEESEGVELLSVLSRYRFFVGVGKLFKFSDVRREIESRVCDNETSLGGKPAFVDEETQLAIDAIKNVITKDKHWTIFVSPAGHIEYASTNDDNDEDYLNDLLGLEKRKKDNGGLILQSNNEDI